MKRNWIIKWNWAKYNYKTKAKFHTWYLVFSALFLLFLIHETKTYWLTIFLFFNLLYLLTDFKKIILFLVLLIICIFIFYWHNINSLQSSNNLNGNYKIVKSYHWGFTVLENNKLVFIYKRNNYFNSGDIVYINGSINKIDPDDSLYFYWKSLKITGLINKAQISIIQKTNNVITNYLQDKNYYFFNKYVNILIFGNKSNWNKDLFEKLKKLNIVHMFIISGFHVDLFWKFINKFLQKFSNKPILNIIIFLLFTISFFVFINVSIPSLRSVLFVVFFYINKNYLKNNFSKIEILSFILFIFFIWNPYNLLSWSTIFSFTITFTIYIIQNNKIKNKFIKNITMILIPYFVSVLLIILLNNKFNLLGLLNIIILTPIISFSYIFSFIFIWNKVFINFYFYFLDIALNELMKLTYEIEINFLNIEKVVALLMFLLFLMKYKFLSKQISYFKNIKNQKLLNYNFS